MLDNINENLPERTTELDLLKKDTRETIRCGRRVNAIVSEKEFLWIISDTDSPNTEHRHSKKVSWLEVEVNWSDNSDNSARTAMISAEEDK